MRVICVKWGEKYGKEWVYSLKRMVKRHLKFNDFVCMTDRPINGITCVPCPEGLPGWWAKVGLFEPGKFPGDNLYLDLDIVIKGNIQGLVAAFEQDKEKVWARDDFSYSLVTPKQGIGGDMRRLLGGDGTVNSSVMLWNGKYGRKVWTEFKPEKMQEVHGDQNWITQALWPDEMRLLPNDLICSYKYHVLNGKGQPPIVVFHGDPKVTDLSKSDPLRQEWECVA